jgi:hypothetical protein
VKREICPAADDYCCYDSISLPRGTSLLFVFVVVGGFGGDVVVRLNWH